MSETPTTEIDARWRGYGCAVRSHFDAHATMPVCAEKVAPARVIPPESPAT